VSTLRSWAARLRDLFRRRRLEAQLGEDLRFHREELEAEFRSKGMSAAEAEAAARRELGNELRIREDFHEQAGVPLLEEFTNDASLAFRSLSKRPGFTFGVVLVLGLGLGLALIVQGLSDVILRRPLPVPHPEELHLVSDAHGQPMRIGRATEARLEQSLGVGRVAGFSSPTATLLRTGSAPAELTSTQMVTGNFFQTLGLQPYVGRLIQASDDQIGQGGSVLVVSHALALKIFGSAQAALGKQVLVNQVPLEVIGVLKPDFLGVSLGRRTSLWVPASLQPALRIQTNADQFSSSDRPNSADWNREERIFWLNLFVRLPSTLSARQAADMARQAFRPQAEDTVQMLQDPEDRRRLLERPFQVLPSPGGYSGLREDYRAKDLLFRVFVTILLVLTCANVSGLLLVRGLGRQREIGVRLALGARRWRICMLIGVEALVLSAFGALLALAFAYWGIPGAAHMLAPGQIFTGLGLDWALIGLLGALVMLMAVGCSFFPAWFLAGLQPQHAISGRDDLAQAPLRVGKFLVALQLGLAVILLGLALSLGGRLREMLTRDTGVRASEVLSVAINPPAGEDEASRSFARNLRLAESLKTMPGVTEVAFAGDGIGGGSISRSGVFVRGEPVETRHASYQGDNVSETYLRTTGLRLIAGRDFNELDNEKGARVAIISQRLARELFGKADPLGRQFGFGSDPDETDCTIVGVVADAYINGLQEKQPSFFLTNHRQWANASSADQILVRTDRPTRDMPVQLLKRLQQLEPNATFTNCRQLDEMLSAGLRNERIATMLNGFFAAAALLLAGSGMAALAAYLVAQRRREFAIRLALGAPQGSIWRGVVGEVLRLGLVGSVTGLVLGWGLQSIPALASRLPSSLSLTASVIAALLCLLAALLATWSSAHRASRTDPLALLRE